ncbi:hypothetical protein SprV_0802507100 [Sparganum proliferum]
MPDVAGLDDVADFTSPRVTIRGSGSTQLHPFSPPATETEYWRSTYPFHALANRVEPSSEFVSSSTSPAVIMPDVAGLDDVADFTSPRVTIRGSGSTQLHPFSPPATETEYWRSTYPFHALANRVEPSSEFVSSSTSPAVIMPDVAGLDDVADFTSPRVTIRGSGSTQLHPFSPPATETEYWRSTYPFHALANRVEPSSEFVSSSTSPAVIMPDVAGLDDVADFTSPRVTIRGSGSTQLHPFSPPATETEYWRSTYPFHALANRVEPSSEFVSSSTSPAVIMPDVAGLDDVADFTSPRVTIRGSGSTQLHPFSPPATETEYWRSTYPFHALANRVEPSSEFVSSSTSPAVIMPDVAGLDDVADFTSPRVTIRGSGSTQLHPFSPPATETEYWRSTYPFHALANRVEPSSEFVSSSTSPAVIMPDVAGLDDVADFTSPRVTIRGSGSTQLHPFSPPATETEYWRSTYPFHALANRVEPSSEFVSSSTSPAVIMPDVAGLDDVADFTSPRVTIRGSGSTQLHPFSPPATETEYWRSTYPFHALANRVEPSSEFVSSSTSPAVIMPDVAGLDDVADFTSPRVTIRGSGSTQLHPFSPPATETEYWRSTYPFHALANRVEPSSEFVSSSTSPAVIMPDVAGLDDVADFTSPRVTIRGSGSTQLHPFSPPATETEYWRSTYPFHALANRVEPSSEFVSSSTSPAVIMPDVAGLDDVADFTSPRVTIRGSGSTQLHPFSPPATETEYWRSTYPFHALANRVEPSSEFVSSSTSPGSSLTLRYLKLSSSSSFSSSSSSSSSYSSSSSQQQSIPGPVLSWSRKQLGNILVFPEFMDKPCDSATSFTPDSIECRSPKPTTSRAISSA